MDLVRNGERSGVSSNPADYGFSYSAERDQPPPEVGWSERSRDGATVSLYSENVVKEGDTTEEVDRESIANLSTTRKQWEAIFTSAQQQEEVVVKKKSEPKWEVKLPTSRVQGTPTTLTTTPAGGDSTTYNNQHTTQSDCDTDIQETTSSSETMSSSGPRDMESAIEYEIRLAREREEMLKQEKQQLQVEKQTKGQGKSIIASYEAVSSESEAYQPAFNELAEADRGPDLWSGNENGSVNRRSVSYDNQVETVEEEIDPNESIIEKEIRLQRQREAELLKQRQVLTPHQQQQQQQQQQQPSQEQHQQQHTPAEHQLQQSTEHFIYRKESIPNIVRHEDTHASAASGAQHSGESIIARELRELKEREEEMRQLRLSLHGPNNLPKEPESSESPQPKPSSNGYASTPRTSQASTPQSQIHEGTWQRDVSPFISQKRRESIDSSSTHSSTVRSSDAYTPSRNVKVHPIADGDEGNEVEEKPDYFKKQETPIEREIRIATERENELRRMKGMPEIVVRKEDDFYAGSNATPVSNNVATPRSIHGGQHKQQSLKNFGANRIQQELNAQKEREMALRNEGKLISTSEDHIQPFKYLEITGSDRSDGSEKRNFSTKNSPIVVTSPPASQNSRAPQTPTQQNTPSSVLDNGASSGQKKNVGSGGKLFSYKEFKQTAESKIEKELREMREREEELRNQRKVSTAETPR